MEKNVFCVAVKTFITNNVEIQPFELMNRDVAKTNGLKRSILSKKNFNETLQKNQKIPVENKNQTRQR